MEDIFHLMISDQHTYLKKIIKLYAKAYRTLYKYYTNRENRHQNT